MSNDDKYVEVKRGMDSKDKSELLMLAVVAICLTIFLTAFLMTALITSSKPNPHGPMVVTNITHYRT